MINKLGLGTVQFGLNYGISNKYGITSMKEVGRILEYSREIGINVIDTAFGYGMSEEVLGNFGVSDFKLVSKFVPATPEYSIREQIKLSFKRLKVGHLYGLLAHRPLDLLDKPEIWEFLESIKSSAKVKKIGFSFNSTEEIDMVLGKKYIPDLIQVPYNYLDHRFESYMIDLKNNGCEIHSRSAFLQGLFFMIPESLGNFFDEIKPTLENLQSNGRALPGMLLKYCLQKPFIDKVILGVNNCKQLTENINSLRDTEQLTETPICTNNDILTPTKWPKK